MTIRNTLAAAATLTLAGLAPAWFAPAWAQTTCDLTTVKGSYAAHGQGWVALNDNLSPEVVVAFRYFDGAGKFTGNGYQSLAGTPHYFKVSGTYTVEPWCVIRLESVSTTGTVTGEPIHFFGVITNVGNKIVQTRIDKGATTETEFDRIVPIN